MRHERHLCRNHYKGEQPHTQKVIDAYSSKKKKLLIIYNIDKQHYTAEMFPEY